MESRQEGDYVLGEDAEIELIPVIVGVVVLHPLLHRAENTATHRMLRT